MSNKTIFKISVFTLLIILSVAFVNFIIISCCVQKTFDYSRKTLECCVDSTVKNVSLNQTQEKRIEGQECKFETYLSEMESLKKGIFDSNTITFLSSFLLVFLGSVLLGINNRAAKILSKLEKKSKNTLSKLEEKSKDTLSKLEESSKNALSKTEIERITMSLYTQIHILRFFSTSIQNELASKKYCIDNFINIQTNELFNMAEDLLNDFHNGKYKYITIEWEKVFDDIFEKMIKAFSIDDVLKIKENKNKTQPIVMTIDKLKNLQTEISRLKEKSNE